MGADPHNGQHGSVSGEPSVTIGDGAHSGDAMVASSTSDARIDASDPEPVVSPSREPSGVLCAGCGRSAKATAVFCADCGHRLGEDYQEDPPTPPRGVALAGTSFYTAAQSTAAAPAATSSAQVARQGEPPQGHDLQRHGPPATNGAPLPQPTPVSADHPASGEGRGRRSAVIWLIAAVLLALFVVPATLFLLTRADANNERQDRPNLERNPQVIARRQVDGVDRAYSIHVAGSVERFYVATGAFTDDGEPAAVSAYANGEEQWSVATDAGGYLIADDDRLFVAGLETPAGGRSFSRRDPASGALIWLVEYQSRTETAIIDGRLYLMGENDLVAVDIGSGEQTVAASTEGTQSWRSELPRHGGFVSLTETDVVVLNRDLQPISSAIEFSGGQARYTGDNIVIADGTTITRYDMDGKMQASAQFRWVSDLVWLDGGRWIYQAENSCGVIDFSGAEVRELWARENCRYEAHGELNAGGAYMVASNPAQSTEQTVLQIADGKEVLPLVGADAAYLAGDGLRIYDYGEGAYRGVLLPGGEEVFNIEFDPDNGAVGALDDGFYLLRPGAEPSTFDLEIYGDQQ